jgi:Spy/CpxP family protein refolding chaperone
MKKYITILSFIVCFIASAQFTNAQEQTKKKAFTPEVTAKQKTHEIHQLVELNGEQQKSIFYLLVDAENNMDAIENSGADVNAIQARKKEVMKYVDDKIKTILTPEQYSTYSQSQESTMNKSGISKDKR